MFGSDKKGHNGMAAITTLIAEGTTIRGDIEFEGGLHLDGEVEGAIAARGDKAVLTLSDSFWPLLTARTLARSLSPGWPTPRPLASKSARCERPSQT